MSLYKNISFFVYIQNKRPELVLTLWVCYTGPFESLKAVIRPIGLLQGPILV